MTDGDTNLASYAAVYEAAQHAVHSMLLLLTDGELDSLESQIHAGPSWAPLLLASIHEERVERRRLGRRT